MAHFVPSPIEFDYGAIFRAVANKSGRMQYYMIKKGKNRQRISKNEFSSVYHKSTIIAISPIQDRSGLSPIQLDLYVK